MKKFTFYYLLLLVLFSNLNIYGQQRIFYENEKKESISFNYLENEFYITHNNSQTLRATGIVNEVIPIYKNTALIKLNKNYSNINTLKTDLNSLYNNSILNVDVALEYENNKHFSSQKMLLSVAKGININTLLSEINLNTEYSLQKHDLINNLNIVSFQNISTVELFNLVSNLNKKNGVIYAEPNLISLIKPHSDPLLGNQWNIENNGYLGGTPGADMKVKDAWNISTGNGVKVAILDNGIQLNHPDLAGNLLPGFDATGLGTAGGYSGSDSHGTKCAGIIAAVSNNIGIRGVAYNAKITPVRIAYGTTGNSWVTDANTIASGFAWAKNNGVHIISNSWGDVPTSTTITNAINDCVNNGRNGKGCVVFFSSGNMGAVNLSYPASLPNVIAVGATSMCDQRKHPTSCDGETSWASNYGYGLSFNAPGVKISTTDISSNYVNNYNGTSAACPNAAAVGALVLAVNPNFTQQQVRDIMESTTDKVGSIQYATDPNYPNGTWTLAMGYGRVNAYKAVLKAYEMTIDLYMKDCISDLAQEPSGCTEFWDSPDIWIRNNQDNQSWNQNAIYRANGSPNYIYVKIRNNSSVASLNSEQLKIYWSKANSSYAWPDYWDGTVKNTNGKPLSGGLPSVSIPSIPPGGTAIISIPWVVPNPADYSNVDEPWHYCIMARVESIYDQMTFPETSDSGFNIRNNNNIAQKNISVVNPSPGNPIGALVNVGNPFPNNRIFNFEFKINPAEVGSLIYEEAEVTFSLDNRLLQTWIDGGSQLNNIEQIEENKFKIIGNNATLSNLNFEPHQMDLLTLSFNFLTAEITDKNQYIYYLIQKDSNNNIIGGETYEIIKNDNRDLFFAQVLGETEVDKNQSVLLSADQINEPAVYNWYDENGNLLHEGIDFNTSVTIGKNYKLEVIALADGYKDYKEVELTLKPNSIETIYPNPATDFINLNYKINNGNSAYLSITGVNISNVSNNYILDINQDSAVLNVSNYPVGIYVITLVTDGIVSDSKNIIIQ